MREPHRRLNGRSRALPWLLALLATLAAVMAAACGGDDDDDAPSDDRTPIPAPEFSAESTMGRLAASGTLIIGVKFDQPGFGFKDPITGEVDGFDVALGLEVASALGIDDENVKFVEAVSARRIAMLQSEEADLIIATMTVTEERKQSVDFTRPYYVAGQSILVRKENTEIREADDLENRKVCTVEGSTSAANLAKAAPRAQPVLLETYADCVAQLKDSRVDAVTTDDSILLQFVARDSTLKLVGGTFSDEPYGIGVPKGREDLVAFLDTILANMLEDGRWDALYEEHIGSVLGLPGAAEARARLPD